MALSEAYLECNAVQVRSCRGNRVIGMWLVDAPYKGSLASKNPPRSKTILLVGGLRDNPYNQGIAERRIVKIVFWLSLIGILYTYVGYPVTMWLLARFRPRPWNSATITPSVSLVLAVRNGVELLPRQIQHLQIGR